MRHNSLLQTLKCGGAIVGLCALTSGVQATSSFYAYDSDGSTYSGTSPSGPVSHNYPRSAGDSSAYANDVTQTLRAFGRATSYDTDGYQSGDMKAAGADLGITRTLAVTAGSSGLAAGTPVTVRLSFALDGELSTGFYNTCPPGSTCGYSQVPNYYWLTTIDVWSSYRLTDPTRWWTDGEGWYPEELVNFSYGARSENYGQDGAYNLANQPTWWLDAYDPGRDGYSYWYERLDWSLTSNMSSEISGGFARDGGCSALPCPAGSIGGVYTGPTDFGTGLLSIDFQTYIGSQIAIDGGLNILSQAYGLNFPAGALADYLNTFQAELVALTSGVELVEYDPTAVPVPAAAWLLTSGLLGLMGVARRSLPA